MSLENMPKVFSHNLKEFLMNLRIAITEHSLPVSSRKNPVAFLLPIVLRFCLFSKVSFIFSGNVTLPETFHWRATLKRNRGQGEDEERLSEAAEESSARELSYMPPLR